MTQKINKISQTVRYRSGAGYEHENFPFTPLNQRQAITWPNGAKIAWCVYLYLEYLELDPAENTVRDPRYGGALGSHFPDYFNYSVREHGNRIGFWRVLEVLDKYDIKPTVAINAMLADRYPRMVQECIDRGWEIAGHGISASQMITSQLSEAEEKTIITRSLNTLEKISGVRPIGWFGQDYSQSTRTMELLEKSGVHYVADFPNDDTPYKTNYGDLICMPNHSEWDDTQLMAIRRLMPWRWCDVVSEAFDYLYNEAHPAGSVMTLSIHPWLLGQAHRIKYLDAAREKMSSYQNVWQTGGAQVAEHFQKNC
jgi:peptidoglycan/xylan/chitin deacetylase (PgdA/CDA1 family)